MALAPLVSEPDALAAGVVVPARDLADVAARDDDALVSCVASGA
jgi:hypothetical protein